jgi:hypothetical protein
MSPAYDVPQHSQSPVSDIARAQYICTMPAKQALLSCATSVSRDGAKGLIEQSLFASSYKF